MLGFLTEVFCISVSWSGSGPKPHTSRCIIWKEDAPASCMVANVSMSPLHSPVSRSELMESPKLPGEPPMARPSSFRRMKLSSFPVESKTAIFGTIEKRKLSPFPIHPSSVLHQEEDA